MRKGMIFIMALAMLAGCAKAPDGVKSNTENSRTADNAKNNYKKIAVSELDGESGRLYDYVSEQGYEDKFFLDKEFKPRAEDFLNENVHVKVNHDKWRLLSAHDANQYLGAYIRPYYVMPRQRTIDKFCRIMRELEYFLIFNDPTEEELMNIRARINSYCGLLSHYKSFNLRKKYLDQPAFYNYFTYDKGFSKSILRPEYGGKPVLCEWYNPPLLVNQNNSPELPRNWFLHAHAPLNLPLEERNALQFLADRSLI